MSAISVTGLAVYGLLYAAIGAVNAGVGAYSWFRERGQKKLSRDEMAQTMSAMEKQLCSEVAGELGRTFGCGGSKERDTLRSDLEDLKKSLERGLDDEAGVDRAVEKLDALRIRVRAAELDEDQCRARTDAARASITALRATTSRAGLSSWEKELDRLEEELDKISGLPAEDRMFELQRLIEELREMEKLSSAAKAADVSSMRERRFAYTPHADKRGGETESRARVIVEIRDWADRIARMDESEGEKLRSTLDKVKADTRFPDKLTGIRDQLKAKWWTLRERAASTAFFREKLLSLLDLLQAPKNTADARIAAELEKRCNTLYGGKYIDRALFMALYEDVARFAWSRAEEIADHFFAQKVEQALAEMGYELLSDDADVALTPGQVSYLDTPYDGYRVMVKADKGTVSTRLVRVMEAESETAAPDRKQKDVETGKKWCRDLDEFLEKMRGQNLPLDVALRKEPEEVELMTVVDPNMRVRKKKRKKKAEAGKLQERAVGQ